MLESAVERRLDQLLRVHGGCTVKIHGLLNWPDRLCLLPHGIAFFVETKRPGTVPRPGQLRCHEMLRKLGHTVLVCEGMVEDWIELERHVLSLMRARSKVLTAARAASLESKRVCQAVDVLRSRPKRTRRNR